MSLEERVYSVLVVSASESFNNALKPMLPNSIFSPVRFEESASLARQQLSQRGYDLVLVNAPLADEAGTRFAMDACSAGGTVVLLLIKNELYAAAQSKTVKHGVYVLPKPVSKNMILQALDWMLATRERLRSLEKKTVSIEDKMQEIRLVNRAKWLLIEELKMSEADAHKYIEKQAMDRCVSKREVAQDLIQLYS